MIQKRNSHDALFRAAQTAEKAFGRRKAAELRQSARVAQQRKDWALAESLWRTSLAEDPGEPMATAGLAQILVYNGKLDEARELANEIVAKWPEDENGPTVLARLAEESGEIDEAIVHWRRVLELVPGRSQALIRLGRLSIGRREFDDAKSCADHLALYAPDNPNAIALFAEIDEARGDLASAVKRRREAVDKFPQVPQLWHEYGAALIAARDFETCEALLAKLHGANSQAGLRLEGQLLAAREPEAGHSAFWKRASEAFPQNADFLRKYLHAALRDGLREEARAALHTLFESQLLRATDTNFVIGMVNLIDEDSVAVRTLVRGFLKRFRGSPDYRRIALRLSRIVFQHFPKTKRAFDAGARTLDMLRHAPADPAASRFVEYTVALLNGFRATGATCLFDTDFSREQARETIAWMRSRLSAGAPTSFIRVGDGESNALAYDASFAHFFAKDAAEREAVWWGRALDDSARAELGARVLEAMQDADALGIPTLERIMRDVKLNRHEFLGPTRAGRGVRTVFKSLDKGGALRSVRALITSAHLQHDLQKWNLYRELFAGLDDIVAVSCHARLPEAFQALFGARIEKNIAVPPRHASLATFGMEMGPKILPEVLDDAIAGLDENLTGRMVIVGAGYAGKVVVHAAKKRGAVALDLGSVLDYWIGASTRSYLTTSAAGS